MARGFGPTSGVGSTDRIETPAAVTPTAITIVVRVNRDGGVGGGTFGRIFDRVNGSAQVLDSLTFDNGTGRWGFVRRFGTTNGQWTWNIGSVANTPYTLAFTHDGTSAPADAYVDGVLSNGSRIVTTTPAGALDTSSAAYSIGNRLAGDRNFDGLIAELAGYDGVLSAAELQAVHVASPLVVRPEAITVYVPLVRDAIDLFNGACTVTGTAIQPHPRVSYALGRGLAVATPASTALASGTASGSGTGSTTASVSVTAATGGTSPYTYQWYRSTSSGFTPGGGNIVSGATSLTLNDTGLSPSTTYYYKVISTDNVAATVTSAQVTVTTSAAAATRNRVLVVL